MKQIVSVFVTLVLALMCCAPTLADGTLAGEWQGVSEGWTDFSVTISEDNTFTLKNGSVSNEFDYMVMGDTIYLSVDGVGKEALKYELNGDALTLLLGGEDVLFHRAGSALGGLTFDAADQAGKVVNVDRADVSSGAQFETMPIEVVLVLDTSGSMAATNKKDGRSILDYAKRSAVFFVETLTSLNPDSRISVVEYASSAQVVSGFTGSSDKDALLWSINNLSANGGTNIGDGFAQANELFNNNARDDCRRVVLMLTDGIANEGPDVITEGRNLSKDASVFNIGLIGALGASEVMETRRVLNAGYETQYFEVDFDSIDEISSALAETFIMIATASSSDANSAFYKLFVSSALDVRINGAEGLYLSSNESDKCDSCALGVINYLGENNSDKLIVLRDGDYTIQIYGAANETCSYSIEKFDGSARIVSRLVNQITQAYAGFLTQLDIRAGVLRQRDASYNPLDISAFDAFMGRLTYGLHSPAKGYAISPTALRLNTSEDAKAVGEVPINKRVQVLWREGEWYLVNMKIDKELYRGYVKAADIEFTGHVHDAVFLNGEYRALYNTPIYTLPDDFSAITGNAQQSSVLSLIHVERDIAETEWAYVQTEDGTMRGYVQASALSGWQTLAPEQYRIRVPELVEIPLNRMSIACGDYCTVALKENGTAIGTGRNESKQLNVASWHDLIAVEVGAKHTLGLMSDGRVVATGHNNQGSTKVNYWKNIIAIAAGDKHTVGLLNDGTVIAIGAISNGKLDVGSWKNVAAITCGYEHVVGIHANGRVSATGNNSNGQLNVNDWKDIIAVAAGGYFTIGLKEDGTVVGVGANDYHQLDVGSWRNIIAISAGDFYCLGLKDDGTVVAAGSNDFGQCNVSRWSGVAQIAAGYRHAVAIKYDGTVLSTGDNTHGQTNVSSWQNIALQDD